MDTVRLGVIGLGNIGRVHADYLLEGKVGRCRLAAIASSSAEKQRRYELRGCRAFGDGVQLIRSGEVDGVIIATPHFQHTALGIAAFESGLHALIEKPVSAHKSDAERLIAAHRLHPQTVFAVLYQMRTGPRYERMRDLVRKGGLGDIVRVNWINTDWYRTEAYYASSDWRATWKGEGGGVLLNQCLHNLDLLQWICGMPRRVRGFCQFGRFHDVEVEDNVSAYLEWAGGATGVFVSSTGEAPGTNRFEIAGTRGRLVLENDALALTRNEADMIEFSRRAAQGFSRPVAETQAVPFDNAALPHALVTQNFVNAILDGEALIAPGEDGIHAVELANAVVYSSLAGQTIELPLDGAAWEARLGRLIAESAGKRKAAPVAAGDMATGSRE